VYFVNPKYYSDRFIRPSKDMCKLPPAMDTGKTHALRGAGMSTTKVQTNPSHKDNFKKTTFYVNQFLCCWPSRVVPDGDSASAKSR
jgi:hypothetical protein